MNKTLTAMLLSFGAVVGATGAALAADDAMGADLKVTIALQGKPCDEITGTRRNGDSDYSVTCKDGNRYHVYVNAQGRVVVDKQ